MDFENKFDKINWSNSGAEPSENLQSKGFEVGYKPSAGVFNWFWSKAMKAITEIQTKLSSSAQTSDNHIANKSNPHGVTASQVGLGNVNNTADKDKPVSTAQATAIASAKAAGTTAQTNLTTHTNNKSNPHGVTAAQVGLGKVNNTADSEKSVKFASEAGVGRKVQYALSILFNGGSTESTDKWTFDGSTSRSVNITADKIGAAKKDLSNVDDDVFKEKVESTVTTGTPIVEATSTDGIAYTATIDGITELYNGLEIIVIPNMTSTKNAVNFNLNNLGAKNIRVKIDGYNNGNSGTIAALATWFGEGVPLTIRYTEKFDMWQTVDFSRQSVSGLYGTVKVEQGGTGADTAEDARLNLEVAPAIEDTTYSGCYYRMVDSEKEWINPPMVKDVEYRTTERYKGNPVYIKLREISDVPQEVTSQGSEYGTGIKESNVNEIVNITGAYKQGSKAMSVGNGGLIIGLNEYKVYTCLFSEATDYTDIVVITKYIK